jgi:ATP-dependent RNA helicase DDX6/DHH1
MQVSSTIKEIGKYLNAQVIIATGGTSIKDDIYRLNNPVQMIVGKTIY